MGAKIEKLQVVTIRLIALTAIVLGLVATGITLSRYAKFPLLVPWVCFGCGLLGGFVSIQQRLKKLGDEELELLSRSWFQILLIPIYGGVFSLVLYLAFLSEIVSGQIFPKFDVPVFSSPATADDLKNFLRHTFPHSGQDAAKLLFWSFIAGFSERLVPQILQRQDSKASE